MNRWTEAQWCYVERMARNKGPLSSGSSTEGRARIAWKRIAGRPKGSGERISSRVNEAAGVEPGLPEATSYKYRNPETRKAQMREIMRRYRARQKGQT